MEMASSYILCVYVSSHIHLLSHFDTSSSEKKERRKAEREKFFTGWNQNKKWEGEFGAGFPPLCLAP